MADYTMTTQAAIRRSFWGNYPNASRTRGRDGGYLTDTRCLFCDYVETLRTDGDISEALAYRATLD